MFLPGKKCPVCVLVRRRLWCRLWCRLWWAGPPRPQLIRITPVPGHTRTNEQRSDQLCVFRVTLVTHEQRSDKPATACVREIHGTIPHIPSILSEYTYGAREARLRTGSGKNTHTHRLIIYFNTIIIIVTHTPVPFAPQVDAPRVPAYRSNISDQDHTPSQTSTIPYHTTSISYMLHGMAWYGSGMCRIASGRSVRVRLQIGRCH